MDVSVASADDKNAGGRLNIHPRIDRRQWRARRALACAGAPD